MDPLKNVGWTDLQMVLWVPLAFITAKELKKNWRQIFDNDLTVQDRSMLQKINLFFLLPIVVLLHECGHAVAVLMSHGKILDFHFAIWWGFVEFSGVDELQKLLITLAGNVVEILIGIAALLLALVVRSPAMVALLVYGGLYAIGGTIIIYALMSFAGMYGDWAMIYSSPLKSLVYIVGAVHVSLVATFLYLIYGTIPRLWFAGKTRPKWFKDYKSAKERVEKEPSAVNYLNLAWQYYFIDLDRLSLKSIEKAGELDPNLLERFMLSGCLRQSKNDVDGAVREFEKITESPAADPLLKCRALMAEGHCLLTPAERETERGKKLTADAVSHVIAAYDQAIQADPTVADPHFYKATVLNKVGLHKDAEKELNELKGLRWLDPSLSELMFAEFRVARKSGQT